MSKVNIDLKALTSDEFSDLVHDITKELQDRLCYMAEICTELNDDLKKVNICTKGSDCAFKKQYTKNILD